MCARGVGGDGEEEARVGVRGHVNTGPGKGQGRALADVRVTLPPSPSGPVSWIRREKRLYEVPVYKYARGGAGDGRAGEGKV